MRIVVTAANGRTGRHVISALQRRGEAMDVVAFCRSGPTPPIPGVTPAQGDLLDATSLDRAFAGADVVIHYGPALDPQETAMGLAAVDAAVRARVARFVYISVIQSQIDDLLNHKSKLQVEGYLINSGLRWTILGPQHYSQTIAVAKAVDDGYLALPYAPETVLGHVDMVDLAEAAAKVAVEPGHDYAKYELSGDDHLSTVQICERISALSGVAVEAQGVPVAKWLEAVQARWNFGPFGVEGCWRLFGYYERHGIYGNSHVLRWLLGRPPTSFDDYVVARLREVGRPVVGARA